MILAIAFAEAIAIYALVIALILKFPAKNRASLTRGMNFKCLFET